MEHKDIFAVLKDCMPFYAGFTREWVPNGENSIKLRLADEREVIFTYVSQDK